MSERLRSQSATETRHDCPVCLGLPMTPIKLSFQGSSLVLDRCDRCGGVWFDAGEAQLSRQLKPAEMKAQVAIMRRSILMHCHSCNVPMRRNVSQCEACGWNNIIACPICQQDLQRQVYGHFTVDICHHCQGIWLDQIELSALWHSALDPVLEPSAHQHDPSGTLRPGKHSRFNSTIETGSRQTNHPSDLVIDGVGHSVDLFINTDLVIEGAVNLAPQTVKAISKTPEVAASTVEATLTVTDAALRTVAHAPEVTETVFEVTGEVAGAVFEGLAAIISSVLSW